MMTNLLIRAAGQDPDVVRQNDEAAKYAGFGGTVVATSVFAAASMNLALVHVHLAQTTRAVAAVLWGLAIFNFDRLIVSSGLGTGWRRAVSMMARVVVAVFIGYVIAEPVVLRVFSVEVQRQLADQFDASDKAIEREAATRAGAKEIAAAEHAVKVADAAVAAADAAVKEALANLDSEVVAGKTGVGYGPVARSKSQQLEDLRAELARRQATAADVRAHAAESAERGKTDVAAWITKRKQEVRKANGLGARLDALDAVAKADHGLAVRRRAIQLLFIAFDSLPALLKLIIPAGRTELDKQEAVDERRRYLRDRRRAEVGPEVDEAWVAAAVLRADVIRAQAAADHEVAVAKVGATRASRLAAIQGYEGPGRRRGVVPTMATVVASALVAAGLTTVALSEVHTGKTSESHPADPAPTFIRAERTTVVDLGGGATVTVPPGAIRDGAKVVATHPPLPRSASGVAIGTPVQVRTVPDGALVGEVTFRFPAGDAGPAGVIRTLNPKTQQWEPADGGTTYEPKTGMLVASSRHFSDWGAFFEALGNRISQDFLQLLGQRGPAAPCKSSEPNWVESVAATNDANAALRACAESEGSTLVMQMVNNRPYSVFLSYGAPVTFGWSSLGVSAADVGRNFAVKNALGLGVDGLFIAPTGRASVGIAQSALVPGMSKNFVAKPTGLTIAFDALYTIVDNLGSVKADRSGFMNALAHALSNDCVQLLLRFQFDSNPGAAQVRDLLQSAFKCIKPLLTSALLSQVGGISREAAGKILGKLDKANELAVVVDVGKIVNSILELLRDGWLGQWGGFAVSSRRPTPKPSAPTAPAATAAPPKSAPAQSAAPIARPGATAGPSSPSPTTTETSTSTTSTTVTSTTSTSAPGNLTLTVTADPFICDGSSKALGTLSGASPGETVAFSSPEATQSLRSGRADGAGRLQIVWQCNPGESGTVHLSARGTSSDRTGTTAFRQVTPTPPPTSPQQKTSTAQYTGSAFGTAGAGGTKYTGEIVQGQSYTIAAACYRPNDIPSNNGWYYQNASTGHWAPGTLFAQKSNEFNAPRAFGGGSSNCN